ncbi:DNA polymerase III subunit epsilon [Parafrankia soli]|uniref:DNA polymerase III subunit epsilon n=1 Tax=Parafrankia soli TaxID=2599596 RepID=A0A1S1QC87_9ACTN|nr:3'-5' exonuclease [Parafrankia soli]OHV31081.1 DNA polymerase III subunit epsilon [Parafrankia soli]
MTDGPWQDAALVAIDLEGSGAQDGEREAILEAAAVPLRGGVVQAAEGYCSVVNPGRRIPRRPWISPGLTDDVLAAAPPLSTVERELAARLDGRILVGHNVAVDWRLLRRRCPNLRPAGLIDTFRLARRLGKGTAGSSLGALLTHHNLAEQVNMLAPGGQPHRALWDAVGAGLLLTALAQQAGGPTPISLGQLRHLAGLPLDPASPARPAGEQTELFG